MRSRNIKPGFFKSEELAEMDPLGRIFFEGLWCAADKEGKLEWRPKRLKVEILPYDNCDILEFACQLEERGFIRAFQVGGKTYVHVANFDEHQSPHHTEKESVIPDPDQSSMVSLRTATESPLFPAGCDSTVNPPLNTGGSTVSSHRAAISGIRNQESGKIQQSKENKDASDPPFLTIPLIHKKKGQPEEFVVRDSLVKEFQEAYPAVDVKQQLREVRQWNISNPKNRKTRDGMLKHINNWLKKEQNRARTQDNVTPLDRRKDDKRHVCGQPYDKAAV